MKYEYPRIRDLREDRDMTQEDVANLLGVYTTTYQRWERGETEIPCHIVVELSKYYKTTTDYLLGVEK